MADNSNSDDHTTKGKNMTMANEVKGLATYWGWGYIPTHGVNVKIILSPMRNIYIPMFVKHLDEIPKFLSII